MTFNAPRAARILADAEDLSDAVAARKWRVSLRTVKYYRVRRQTDPDFAALFTQVYSQSTAAWQAERTSALRAGLEKMKELIGKATATSDLKVVTDAVRTLGEFQVTVEALNEPESPEADEGDPRDGAKRPRRAKASARE